MTILRVLNYLLAHPIGSKAKIASIKRFIQWQIAQKIVRRPILMPFLGESVFLVKKGMTGATGNIYSGLHEFEEMAFLLHFLREEDLFFDVGSNVGTYTLLASKVIGAKSYAFEPSPQTFFHLENNVFLNRINEKVQLYNEGIGAEDGNLLFSVDQDTTNHVVTNEKEKSVAIKVSSLDSISTAKQAVPQLVKIDVEGFESNVIQGATNLLQNKKLNAIIMELNGSGGRYGFNEDALHQKVLDYGFQAYHYLPFKRKIVPAKDRSYHGNTIYIRNLAAAKERVAAAPYFNSLGVEF